MPAKPVVVVVSEEEDEAHEEVAAPPNLVKTKPKNLANLPKSKS